MTPQDFKDSYRALIPNERSDIRELSAGEMLLFMKIFFGSPSEEVSRTIEEKLDAHPLIQIFNSRLSAVGLFADVRTKLFLGSTMTTPGRAVLWAYTVAKISRELGRCPTSDDLFMDTRYFANGIPTEDFYNRAWDSQKARLPGRPDNYLDWPELWPRNPAVACEDIQITVG